MRVYLAGPLFTPYERRYVDECATALRAAGHDVFVPHENVLATAESGLTAEYVFKVDARGLEEADAVVALLDGPMVDDGTACEVGLFYGLKQGPIVGLSTDLRGKRSEGHGLNLFVEGCIEAVGEICDSIEGVLDALERRGPR